jgi:cytochrome c biogenesis protein CcmG, thiol:disulfide interchange protein DsbE
LPVRATAKRLAVVALVLSAGTAAAASRPPIAGRDVQTGAYVSLRQYARKPVFVNVWGSWCYACNREARTLVRFARTHRGVAVLGIDVEDSRAGARAWYRRYGRAYPSIWDPQSLLAGYWSRGAPTTLVFDRRHLLVRRIEGAVTAKQLAAALTLVTRR